MKDSELRGLILEQFYRIRHQPEQLVNPLGIGRITDLDPNQLRIVNVCEQLAEDGLLRWESATSQTSFGGFGRITARGVDVVEGTVTPPITVTLHDHSIHDHSVAVTESSSVQIGDSNTMLANVKVDKVIAAIDHSMASDEAKQEAKSLIEKVLNNPILKGLVKFALGSGQ
jgi:hypothetical protein